MHCSQHSSRWFVFDNHSSLFAVLPLLCLDHRLEVTALMEAGTCRWLCPTPFSRPVASGIGMTTYGSCRPVVSRCRSGCECDWIQKQNPLLVETRHGVVKSGIAELRWRGVTNAVEAERSDPGMNGWWMAVGSGSGAMNALPRAYNLMRMDDGDVDERIDLISDIRAT